MSERRDSAPEWIAIPGGAFFMGAQAGEPAFPGYDAAADPREAPVHEIELAAFEIAAFPVTVAAFERFVAAGAYDDERLWHAGGFGLDVAPLEWRAQCAHLEWPVTSVSWFEAMAYACWAQADLPTEAQWERAARGTAGRRFPWGDLDPEPGRLNALEAGVGGPSPFGAFPRAATPEGAHDLAGNVWEWCRDVYGGYLLPVATGSGERRVEKSGDAQARVMRGGCFAARWIWTRPAFRSYALPEHRFGRRGFRLARSAVGQRVQP
jgi:gamma-glutamyl hercynylcysteine S-oxide synthase